MDEIIRMMTGDGMVKAVAVTGKDMVERARQIHKTLPVATAALGRTLMAASMMGDMLKEKDGSVTLQIKGGGPLGAITAVSDSRGNPRGYLQNGQVDIPRKYQGKLDVGTAVGSSGSLTVMKDMGLKEPYIGSVQLVSGEIAEDITAYFVESEQVPTACALGVLVDKDQSVAAAGGYLVQLLPGADESVIQRLEESIARLGPVTDALHGGADAVQLLERQASWTCRRSGLFQSFCAARLPIRFWTATRSFSSCAAIIRFACTTFRRWASTSTLRRKRF